MLTAPLVTAALHGSIERCPSAKLNHAMQWSALGQRSKMLEQAQVDLYISCLILAPSSC